MTDQITIHPTNVLDAQEGDIFCDKRLCVNRLEVSYSCFSISRDMATIQYIETAEVERRKGYARLLLLDMIREHQNIRFFVDTMTNKGRKFFSAVFDIERDGSLKPQATAFFARKKYPILSLERNDPCRI